MMQQYLSIKDAYPDAILFYRMGDFYEMFFEDAELASRLLEITLTSRNKNDVTPIPMCGVPYRAVKSYISRLINLGHKVAICDQVEDPAAAKGLVKRDVVRVVTPGMIVEDDLLDDRADNYVLAVARNQSEIGVAYLDISTGRFRLTESGDTATILGEIQRISPREILLPESHKDDAAIAQLLSDLSSSAQTHLDDHVFEFRLGREALLSQYGTLTLEGFGCENLKAAVSAAGALLSYVRETQKQKIDHLFPLETYSLENYLFLDETSCRNLELLRNLRSGSQKGTLLSVVDKTVTSMGGRRLRRWIRYPLADSEAIEARLDAVAEAKRGSTARKQIREGLKSVYDLERLSSKISMGHANARDLISLKVSLQSLPGLWHVLSDFDSYRLRPPEGCLLNRLSELGELIEKAIREDPPPTIQEGGLIRLGFDPELDELIAISRDGKGWLAELEGREKEATGISTLKVRYNRVFGYYIEVSKAQSEAVPSHYVRKQTLVNAERYITDELKAFESKLLNAEDQRNQLELQIFYRIRDSVVENHPAIQKAADFLADTDCIFGLAEVAELSDYSQPEINRKGEIRIEDGRHPVVEKMITGERFVPNSIVLDNEKNQILIITGPNMAGKSTVLRQVALIVLLAHIGSFVPAQKASISITDRIYTRVGALDNLSQGQSTFMVEMEETANILNSATAASLVIMDEIGRGTSTFDGLSIAWAVAEYLHDLKSAGVKTLFATHYHELTALSESKQRVRNFNIAVREWNDQIIFLRKLAAGGTNRSYGIQVARLAGIPHQVVDRAKKVLSTIESKERQSSNAPLFASVEEGPVQIDLFRPPEDDMVRQLRSMDLTRMTPLDALNFLSEFQERLKTDTD